MTRTQYARSAALWLLGIGLLSLATLYAQMALWPLSAALALGAVLCVNTALYVHHVASERAAWAQQAAQLGRMVLLPELDAAVPDCPCCPPEGR